MHQFKKKFSRCKTRRGKAGAAWSQQSRRGPSRACALLFFILSGTWVCFFATGGDIAAAMSRPGTKPVAAASPLFPPHGQPSRQTTITATEHRPQRRRCSRQRRPQERLRSDSVPGEGRRTTVAFLRSDTNIALLRFLPSAELHRATACHAASRCAQ